MLWFLINPETILYSNISLLYLTMTVKNTLQTNALMLVLCLFLN